VNSELLKFGDGSYKCSDCEYASKVKACVKIHTESKHINTGGFTCQDCGTRTIKYQMNSQGC
jgi:DNA-directed RNA polymerase subunit RPC12/RpoP